MIDDTLKDRRQFLLKATSTLGMVGVGLSTVPFIASMSPSDRTRSIGAPVEVDISQLEPGQMVTVAWRGKPVWILRRTPEVLNRLKAISVLLADPDSKVESQQPPYASNVHRSIKPEYLVVVGLCTHLGCVPLTRLAVGTLSGLGDDWPGGYFCPCHGSKFDLAGRVFKNVPATHESRRAPAPLRPEHGDRNRCPSATDLIERNGPAGIITHSYTFPGLIWLPKWRLKDKINAIKGKSIQPRRRLHNAPGVSAMLNQQRSIPSLCLGFGGLLAMAFWTPPAPAMTLDDLPRIHAIAAPAEQPDKLYLATGAGLFVAAGDGSVAKISKHSDRYLSLAAQAVEPEILLASGASASTNLGVVVSRDQGSTWKQLSAGAGGPVGFRTLAISHTDPKIMYGQDEMLQASSDGGVTWKRVSRVPAHVYNLAVSARDPRTVYAATQTGLLISRDGGVRWRTLHEEDYPATMVHVAKDGTVHAFVLAKGLVRAKEPDLDWKTVSAQFGEQALVSFTVDRGDNHHLYALNQFNRVLTSVDSGATWQALGGDRQPQTEAARRGEPLYQTHCQACHGQRGVGENHGERSLRDRRYIRAPALDDSTHAWHHSDDNLVSTILDGSKRAPRMRAFKDILSRTDALDIVAYMKSLWGPRAIACQGARHMDRECQPPR